MISEKMNKLGRNSSVIRRIFEYGKLRKEQIGEENVFDFSLGNPSVPSPAEVNETLAGLLNKTDSVALHGYTSAAGDISVRKAIASYLNDKYGADESFDGIYLTVGAAAALMITLTALICDGDEVIVFAPFFPEYRVFAEKAGAVLKPVAPSDDFQIDIGALEKAVNFRTKALIINSPCNPSGVILNEATLGKLGKLLREKENEYGHAIYLISDEPYRELVYDGKTVPYTAKYYDDTISCYSFSKSLSLPGERIGYINVCKKCSEREELFYSICGAGRALGYVCAPSLFQKMIPSVLGKTSDIGIYERNRKKLFTALTEYGFKCIYPDGAFYLFVKAPGGDAEAFCEKAKKYELLLVPSDSFGVPGYVRIAYCVSEEMLGRSLAAFEKLSLDCGLMR